MVIVLNSYEKNSFYRLFFIFISAFLLLFLTLSTLYYYKERQRVFQEKKLENRLEFVECQHLQKLLKSKEECQMSAVILTEQLKPIYQNILLAFFITLIFITLFSFFLAHLSLKPIRDSVETMDNFINGIVHDINTPLSVISINAQSLRKKLADEKLLSKSSRIMQGVAHIEALEEQLLFMLRIHQYRLTKTTFNLFALLQQRQNYYRDIRESIEIIIEGEECFVYADEYAITRMVDNIVINAIKYSQPHSQVILNVQKNFLSIKDYGEGIKKPKEVFNKYYRESHNTKGLGLGLYVVKEIANLHNITIDLKSTLGKGSEFILNLEYTLSSSHK